MSSWLTKLLALFTAIGGFFTLLFRAKSKQHKAQAQLDRERAELAEASSRVRQRIAQSRSDIQTKHSEEQRDADKRLAEGDRDHLDTDW